MAIIANVTLSGILKLKPTSSPPPVSTTVDLLMVAGGGGGGVNGAGGGGGAGGLRYLTNQTVNAGTTYTITVGAGGSAAASGTSSVFAAPGFYSNLFDGNGDKLTIPANQAFGFGTGDFTVESWIYQTSRVQPNNFNQIVGTHNAGASADWALWIRNDGALAFYLKASDNDYATSTIPLNAWTHIAVTRQSGTLKFWINGVESGSAANRGSNVGYTDPLGIGDAGTGVPVNFTGYISNVRIVKGTAVYTANFTPTTNALTAVPNTVLLTCQSSTFVDNSPNNFTLTPSGDVSVSTFTQASLVAAGGGAGGNFNAWNSCSGGAAGGSGGGGASSYAGGCGGGAAVSGQGNAGGIGNNFFSYSAYVGGGGGGAGAVGDSGYATGNGGNGLQYWGEYYAGGGGSSVTSEGPNLATAGGLGGGGAGTYNRPSWFGGTAGTANTGGGGGGWNAGGSGVVIVRQAATAPVATTSGSPTITVSGGYRYYKFTSSGLITF